MKDAILFVVTGPSGSGKGTIMHAITDAFADIEKIATYTTRAPRPGEQPGYDYHFVSQDEYLSKVADGKIAEYEKVYNDYYYGSPSFDPGKGPDRLMELDYKGMFKYEKITHNMVSIFIAPPSINELVNRINRRASESNLANRIRNAIEQLQYAQHYTYIILNEDLEQACEDAVAIVRAERCKRDKAERVRQIDKMCEMKSV